MLMYIYIYVRAINATKFNRLINYQLIQSINEHEGPDGFNYKRKSLMIMRHEYKDE